MDDVRLTVIGIGASAGGIEAFRRFFGKMPPDSGMSFVVVLHLAADRKSMLPEIVGRWTAMPVTEAQDGDTLVADNVLVVPPGNVAGIRDGRLTLRRLTAGGPRETTPIDTFFNSMAESLKENAVGVILSGTGHDGALGLLAIKMSGGLTLAQGVDGSSPDYSGMPDSAVAAGAVDLVLPVEQMPTHIITARDIRMATARDAADPAVDLDRIRLAICDILQSQLGHDFSGYKKETFMRRVERRMQVLGIDRHDSYLARLKTDREQVPPLFRDLLISVTHFFRDAPAFAALQNTVIPRLFEGKDSSADLRIWVPGCATGEEAYSLAILLREYMDKLPAPPSVRIFASDIDEAAIAVARAGHYPAATLDGMSIERRTRFFTGAGPGNYAVRQELREFCTFSAHSLIRDPPFSRMEMISCRNLLIYLNADLQDRVVPVFHYALVPGGTLFLGASETIGQHERLFQPLDRLNRIFVRLTGPSDMSNVYRFAARQGEVGKGRIMAQQPDPRTHWPNAVAVASRRVMEHFAAPFVVVGANGDIVHFSSHTGRFLEPAHGSPTTNLFEMARQGWGLELRSLLRRCIETGRPAVQERTIIAMDGAPASPVRLVVEPLAGPDDTRLYLIVFAEAGPPYRAVGADHTVAVLETDDAVAQLERENRDLREQLQSVVEEHATSVEELRSSNEELQSVNEELQSSNEELETSREEIQSINEELNTVNTELTVKVDELDRSNGDLKNLFESTKVATVFLDPYLVIRSFTPEIGSIYNLIPGDIGRPFGDIVGRLSYTSLRDDVQTVLRTGVSMEKRVQRQDGSAHYLMRIMPYRTPDSTTDGSLITFVDVTAIVRAEEHQRLLVDELNHRVKNMLTVVISLATNTLRRSATLEGFQEAFLGRLRAFTAAYTLLSRDGWSPVALRAILMEELTPFLNTERLNFALSGPDVVLESRVAVALQMAVHELATNAVKYGALSVPEGNLEIRWIVDGTPGKQRVTLTWIERDGPPVDPPNRRGFGITMIERVFAQDAGGETKMDFRPDGVVATLIAPTGPHTAHLKVAHPNGAGLQGLPENGYQGDPPAT